MFLWVVKTISYFDREQHVFLISFNIWNKMRSHNNSVWCVWEIFVIADKKVLLSGNIYYLKCQFFVEFMEIQICVNVISLVGYHPSLFSAEFWWIELLEVWFCPECLCFDGFRWFVKTFFYYHDYRILRKPYNAKIWTKWN